LLGSYLGTGWIVAPGIVVTNRHVAREFARLAPGNRAVFRNTVMGRPFRPVIDFREEFRRFNAPGPAQPALEFRIIEVLYLAPDDDVSPDIALLRVEMPNGRIADPIPLSDKPLRSGQAVAAIGYPGFDRGEADRVAMLEIFQSRFDVKRLSPGEVMIPTRRDEWFFTHDCSTLAGNSGSVMLDMETGMAIGLHYSGTSGAENYAVGIEALKTALAGIVGDTTSLFMLPPLVSPRSAPLEAAPFPVAHFDNRRGYSEDFLQDDIRVPMPAVVEERRGEIAQRLDGQGEVLLYTHFSVIVNADRRFPMVTAVNIDGDRLRRVPGKGSWRLDPRIAEEAQADNSIYVNNNLDRGHMVRRLDPVWGTADEARQANADTFHYTNACPQDHTFNDEMWGDLEDHILDSAPHDNRLCVLTGPVLATDDPEYRGIRIPRSFWKVVAWRDGDRLQTAGFILKQDEYLGNLEFNPFQFSTYKITLTELGVLAGLNFGDLTSVDVFAGAESLVFEMPVRSIDDIGI
jgi:endonuclease G